MQPQVVPALLIPAVAGKKRLVVASSPNIWHNFRMLSYTPEIKSLPALKMRKKPQKFPCKKFLPQAG